jgi:hypothetical protein
VDYNVDALTKQMEEMPSPEMPSFEIVQATKKQRPAQHSSDSDMPVADLFGTTDKNLSHSDEDLLFLSKRTSQDAHVKSLLEQLRAYKAENSRLTDQNYLLKQHLELEEAKTEFLGEVSARALVQSLPCSKLTVC